MKSYLSFGGGVNSVAMMLLLLEEGVDFEAIFVNHGSDWPETYSYVAGFQWWLKQQGYRPITILRPDVNTREGKRFSVLYDFYKFKRLTPSVRFRSCTKQFKMYAIRKYCERPCFMFIGIDSDEAKRAKIAHEKGIENRWPLIEREIDREGCKKIIRDRGLPGPHKSGYFCCPFMG